MPHDRLLRALRGGDLHDVTLALIALHAVPESEAMGAIDEFWSGAGIEQRKIAAVALGTLGDVAKDRLLELLDDPNPELVEYALLGYGELPSCEREVIERFLWAGDVRVIRVAAVIFGQRWPDDAPQVLDPLFGHPDEALRCHVLPYVIAETCRVEAIERLTTRYRLARHHLRLHIEDAISRVLRMQPDLQEKVLVPAHMLKRGIERDTDLAQLEFELRSPNLEVIFQAAHDIVAYPIDQIEGVLRSMFEHPAEMVRRRAIRKALADAPERFIEELIARLQDDVPEVRERAASGLARMRLPVEIVLPLLRGE